MKRTIQTLVLSLALCACAYAADFTTTADRQSVAVGETFVVTVYASIPEEEACTAAAQLLRFDNSKLQLITQTAGTGGMFLPDGRSLETINDSGEIRAGVFSLLGTVSGDVTLGQFTFQALAEGDTDVTSVAYDAVTEPFGNRINTPDNSTIIPSTPAVLTITVDDGGSGGSNEAPKADADSDQTVTDADNDGMRT